MLNIQLQYFITRYRIEQLTSNVRRAVIKRRRAELQLERLISKMAKIYPLHLQEWGARVFIPIVFTPLIYFLQRIYSLFPKSNRR